jgi:hypothetical protein
MTGERPDKIDELLDRALAGYVSAESRPGLEKRVLTYVHRARSASWVKPAFSLLALASVAIALVLLWPGNPRATVPTRPEPKLPPLASNFQAGRQLVLPAARATRRTRHRTLREPKLPVFPAPQPLTREELALLSFASKPVEEVPPELLGPRKIEPLQIEPIEIKPLPSVAAKEN